MIRGRLLALSGDLDRAAAAIRDALQAGWGPEEKLEAMKELKPVLARLHEKKKPGGEKTK